ncbi:hypothetical protein B0H13DRAFT_1854371 [Mycena leptocephala]|nr:hypothetical protein B0H13DRAFT_1854371 [Mycena leptocephala]
MATVGFAYGSFGDILESIRIIAKIIDTARRGGKPSSEWEMTEKDLKALNEVLSYLSTHQGTLLDHFVADRLLKESERCKATTLSIHSKITASRGLYERIRWAVTEENTLAEYRAVLAVHRAALDEVHKLIIGAMLKDTQNSVVEVGKNFREDVKGISQQLTDHEQTVSFVLLDST